MAKVHVGGPWTYEGDHTGEPTGADKEVNDGLTDRIRPPRPD